MEKNKEVLKAAAETTAADPSVSSVPASNIEPGTEGAPHTGLVEPHSPAANALPKGGASGVVKNDAAVGSNAQEPLDIGVHATSERITSNHSPLPKNSNPNDVRFKVAYPKDWKGARDMKDGSVQVVSKESAEHFTKIGIGSVIK